MSATERRAIGDMKAGLTVGARPRLSIFPRAAMIYGSRALEYGADKYARGNYHGPAPAALAADPTERSARRLLGYIDAALRHLTHVSDGLNRALGTGGDLAAACATVDDEASGGFPPSMLPHLAHAAASINLAITCGSDDALLPADPGTPWVALMTAPATGAELPQKDDPAAERERVERANADRRASERRADAAARHKPRRRRRSS